MKTERKRSIRKAVRPIKKLRPIPKNNNIDIVADKITRDLINIVNKDLNMNISTDSGKYYNTIKNTMLKRISSAIKYAGEIVAKMVLIQKTSGSEEEIMLDDLIKKVNSISEKKNIEIKEDMRKLIEQVIEDNSLMGTGNKEYREAVLNLTLTRLINLLNPDILYKHMKKIVQGDNELLKDIWAILVTDDDAYKVEVIEICDDSSGIANIFPGITKEYTA